ncbi:Kinesin-like protein KIF20A [Thelohanellus kitauei]|uniref:Kinesin-like protein KIF20A n=1 Tax=Thelohanellus kitauei TaxID=669202 RepID=A0A0C2M8S5_THEKT|nr:Kinesin-like protein KIF20A [Thelohanellus kitauei]
MSAEYVSFVGDSFSKNEDAVKVLLRIRPPFANEENDINNFEIVSRQQLNVKVPESSWTYKNIKRHHIGSSFTFEFSNIFDWSATQHRLFTSLVDGIVLDFLSGKNGLLFTYGITNSGKTYTLIGTQNDPGILPRTINYVFKCLKNYKIATDANFRKYPYRGVVEVDPKEASMSAESKCHLFERFDHTQNKDKAGDFDPVFSKGDMSFDFLSSKSDSDDEVNLGIDVMNIPLDFKTTLYIYMSIAEIYNEQVFDLLDLSIENENLRRIPLKIQGDHKSGFFVKNLTSVLVSSAEEAFKILKIGLSHRKTAETMMNLNSSRRYFCDITSAT